jgi:hypothetical protein
MAPESGRNFDGILYPMGHIYFRDSIQQLHFCLRSCQKVITSFFRKMAIHITHFTVPGFETAKTVELRGSWDGYSAYYLLVRDERSTVWKGAFPLALQPGQHRYHVWTPPPWSLATLL